MQHISSIIRRVCRETDVFARLGGDEFVVALPREVREGAEALARRVKEAVASTPVPQYPEICVSVSAGCASLSEVRHRAVTSDCSSSSSWVDSLVGLADKRMYEDKLRQKRKKVTGHSSTQFQQSTKNHH